MEILLQKLSSLQQKAKSIERNGRFDFVLRRVNFLLRKIKTLGANPIMDEYEKRKLGIFNLLNAYLIVSGILIPLIGFLTTKQFKFGVWLIACAPVLVSILCLYLNYKRQHERAILSYFILYPFFTCVVYINGINLGSDLSFILFGILSVFFLQEMGYMLFAIAFSMLSYFILGVVLKNFRYDLSEVNQPFYLCNQLLVIAYIHYGLWLIKRENSEYQLNLVKKSRSLHRQNIEIQQQKNEIAEKAKTLSFQTRELTELNNVKNKLFSIISHDLKLPLYALRTIFRSMQEQKQPAKEIKAMIPDVVDDLNYTINLMENLLEWAKSQMQADTLRTERLDIVSLIGEVTCLLRTQAEIKEVKIEKQSEEPIYIMADKEMMSLVLRNLISNALKFTPAKGCVSVGTRRGESFVEVYVKDTGTGMSPETIQNINKNNYYSSNGTSGENGTGLGLLLCKEFLAKNGGRLHIKSTLGEGSTFSFIIPRTD